jgi:hypothetical protein
VSQMFFALPAAFRTWALPRMLSDTNIGFGFDF